jgi:hypothetical protein
LITYDIYIYSTYERAPTHWSKQITRDNPRGYRPRQFDRIQSAKTLEKKYKVEIRILNERFDTEVNRKEPIHDEYGIDRIEQMMNDVEAEYIANGLIVTSSSKRRRRSQTISLSQAPAPAPAPATGNTVHHKTASKKRVSNTSDGIMIGDNDGGGGDRDDGDELLYPEYVLIGDNFIVYPYVPTKMYCIYVYTHCC